jgi:hypothetical protein
MTDRRADCIRRSDLSIYALDVPLAKETAPPGRKLVETERRWTSSIWSFGGHSFHRRSCTRHRLLPVPVANLVVGWIAQELACGGPTPRGLLALATSDDQIEARDARSRAQPMEAMEGPREQCRTAAAPCDLGAGRRHGCRSVRGSPKRLIRTEEIVAYARRTILRSSFRRIRLAASLPLNVASVFNGGRVAIPFRGSRLSWSRAVSG